MYLRRKSDVHMTDTALLSIKKLTKQNLFLTSRYNYMKPQVQFQWADMVL